MKNNCSKVPFIAVSRGFSLRRSWLRAPGAMRLSPAEQNQYGRLLPPQFQLTQPNDKRVLMG